MPNKRDSRDHNPVGYGTTNKGGRLVQNSVDVERSSAAEVHSSETGRSPESKSDFPTPIKTILLAEDEQAVRALVRRILENEGYRVLPAKNGLDALQVWDLHPDEIDMVITDVVMPHLSGSGLAQELCSRVPGLKVLFMSGYTEDAIVHHGIRSNVINFLEKPFAPTALIIKTREILAS